ncbi:MAG: PTS galactitol transporter subunit IIC [Clostridia bacterium BRH_c25]|nr:MAG: PTS galactitol transporter subunit IIC [Clostridia bacterium BRH_c25]
MQQFKYTITDDLGIHARPAGMLVRLSMNYECELAIINSAGKLANLKKIFTVMGLGVKCSDIITVTANGVDEMEAITALERFFLQNL